MIIGFTGKMGAGKSTAVEVFSYNRKEQFKLVKFAQPLYDMQEFIYRRISTVYERPVDFIKDRKLLQFLGTEWGRECTRADIWVDLWKKDALKHLDNGLVVLCDDVRFDNEALMIKSLGGVVVEILSPSAQNRLTAPIGIENHLSESGINKQNIDYRVLNTGTKSEYQDQINNLLQTIFATTYGAE